MKTTNKYSIYIFHIYYDIFIWGFPISILLMTTLMLSLSACGKRNPNELDRVSELIGKQKNKKIGYSTDTFNVTATYELNSRHDSTENYLKWEKTVLANKVLFICETQIGLPNPDDNTTKYYWMLFCDYELKDGSLLHMELSTPKDKCKDSNEFRKLVLPHIIHMVNKIPVRDVRDRGQSPAKD